jgi:cytochrome c biogenesis factor
MHVFAILRNVLVKFEHAELISISASITFSQSVSIKIFFRTKTETAEKKFKTQRNKFNNLKKQAKQRFYDNINEHLDDLKTVKPVSLSY